MVLAMSRACRIHGRDPGAFRLRCCYNPGARADPRALDRADQQQSRCNEPGNGKSLCRLNQPQRCVGL